MQKTRGVKQIAMTVWKGQLERLDSLCSQLGTTRGEVISILLTAYRLFLERRKADNAYLVMSISGDKIRFTTTLPRYQIEWLKKENSKTRSELVRNILNLFFAGYLDRYLPPEMRQGGTE